MMVNEVVRYEVEGRIAVVTADNPPVNALGAKVRQGVVAAFERAVEFAGPGGTVVVATHRKPIMVVLQHVLGLTTERSWRLAAAPASLTGVEVWADGVMSVAFTNDTHHHGDA